MIFLVFPCNGLNKDFKKAGSTFLDSIFNDVEKGFKRKFYDSTPKKNSHTRKFFQFFKSSKRGTQLERSKNIPEVQIYKEKKAIDSLKLIKGIQSIIIAIHNDSINYKHVASVFAKELKKKGIASNYYFKHFKNDSLLFDNSNNKLIELYT